MDDLNFLHWIAAGGGEGGKTNIPTKTSTKILRDNIKNIQTILSNDPIALSLLLSTYQRQQVKPRRSSFTPQIAEDYEARADHLKAMNIICGVDLDQFVLQDFELLLAFHDAVAVFISQFERLTTGCETQHSWGGEMPSEPPHGLHCSAEAQFSGLEQLQCP